MTLCDKCSKRDVCKELCADALAYADQDHVEATEMPVGQPVLIKEDPFNDIISPIYLTPREKELMRLLGMGLSYNEIAKVMGVKHRTIWTYMSRLRHKT